MKLTISQIACMLSIGALLNGCAGGVSSMVSEQDKDPANSYDGQYVATVKHPGGRQQLGNNWIIDCGLMDFTSAISIIDSQVNWSWDEDVVIQGFVDSQGRFRIEQPLSDGVEGIGVVLSDNSQTIILQGILSSDNMKGRLVSGMGQFNGRGCTYPVTYAKAN